MTDIILNTWINWHGGKCPVPVGTKGKVQLRNTPILQLRSLDKYDWQHKPDEEDSDIIAFMVTAWPDGHKPLPMSQQLRRPESDYTELRAMCGELATALKDAQNEIEDWGQYAGDYFQDKHDLEGCVRKYDAILAKWEKMK